MPDLRTKRLHIKHKCFFTDRKINKDNRDFTLPARTEKRVFCGMPEGQCKAVLL